MFCPTTMTRDMAAIPAKSSNANACSDVPRRAATAAVCASLPVKICASFPATRWTSAMNAGRSFKPCFSLKLRPLKLATDRPVCS